MRRGEIIHKARASQLNDFSGLRYGKITPTDIDLFMDFGNKVFIVGEIKYKNKPCDGGQYLAILRFVDRLAKTGDIKALMFIAEHETHDPEEAIDVANCIIREYRTGRVTNAVMLKSPEKKITVRTLIDSFLMKNGINYV